MEPEINIPRGTELTTTSLVDMCKKINEVARGYCEAQDSYEYTHADVPLRGEVEFKNILVKAFNTNEVHHNWLFPLIHVCPGNNEGFRLTISLCQHRSVGFFCASLYSVKFWDYEQAFTVKKQIEQHMFW